jgi:hypothetical protein
LKDKLAEAEECKATLSALTDPLRDYGGFIKIMDKNSIIMAVGGAIVGLLSVIMKKTQAVTRLRTVCEALFRSSIFGVEATKVVLAELYKKYVFCEHQSLFAAWKVLRAIDTLAVGGLNHNGIETLQTVEKLKKYERGVLPSRSSVQRCAYELNEVGQQLIPFEKKT